MNEYLLDSSALVEFFEGSDRGARVCGIIEDHAVATSHISIAELSDVFTRKNKKFAKQLNFLRKHVHIVPLSIDICA